jgi:hypothetical protein
MCNRGCKNEDDCTIGGSLRGPGGTIEDKTASKQILGITTYPKVVPCALVACNYVDLGQGVLHLPLRHLFSIAATLAHHEKSLVPRRIVSKGNVS